MIPAEDQAARAPAGPTPADAARRSGSLRLGGMALRNGLLIHGPTMWAAAVRRRDGEVEVGSGRKPRLAPGLAARAPGLRGPLKLAEAMLVVPLVRLRLPAVRLPFEDPRVIGVALVTMAVGRLLRGPGPATPSRELASSVIGLAPAIVSLRGRDLAAYHGVEHKAIGAYEQGLDDPADAAKEHERCGSNLIAPLVVFQAAGQVLLERLVEEPTSAHRALAAAAGVSAAVEAFAWSERHRETALARAFHRPGTEIQRLVATREPTSEQLDVGRAALAEILRVENAQEG